MLTAQHELHVVEGLLCEECECFLGHFHDFLAFELGGSNAFFRKKSVLSFVFAQLEHGGVLECYWCCHSL